MAERTVRELEARLDGAAGLSEAERTIVRVAGKATREPSAITENDVAVFAAATGSRGNFVEAASVVAQFNFITRIADALGVELEIPEALRRFELGRRLAIRLAAWLMRRKIDFRARDIAAADPQQTLAAMERLFVGELGFRERPGYFDRLAARPYLLEAQARMVEAFLTKNELGRATVMQVARVVASLTGETSLEEASQRWIERNPAAASPPQALLGFARDVTLHAYKVTDERVEALRRAGFADAQILDLAAIASSFNASARLAVLLSPPQVATRGRPETFVAAGH